ncbi:oxidoreductase [Limnohabitans sp. 2KL-1]|jgi:predicted dehydrogenase|uniref:oxidoreductase n=1 Tax=Limnohabitans sp. 2KL-1 TaxID=1100699 RepID=UPI000D33DBD5|nr:oxidoreductase [Limnohabitans sp. 2KL-1]PUE50547.1 oxidoreductase [Limnohabitans sp. 2KL-1]
MTAFLNVGLLGYGYASATFHAPLIAAVPGLQLAAVASRRPGDVLAHWPDTPVCETPEALIARPDIDLVVIATPNDTHAPLAAQALAAGKHVVVDKPFTLNAAEARHLIALAEQHQRVLSVFHNRRWDGDFLTLQALLQSGELGRVTHVESHFDRYRPVVRQRWRESGNPGSGLWYDLGPHLLDQALQLFGQPQSLWLDLACQRDGAQADDWFHAVLRYDSLRVVLHASALTARVAPRFVVHGTNGSCVKWGLDTQEDALKAGLRPDLTDTATDWGLDPQPLHLTLSDSAQQLTERQQPCLRGDYPQYYARVRDAVLHGSANPVPAQEALQVMALIELGLQSAAHGRVMALAG